MDQTLFIGYIVMMFLPASVWLILLYTSLKLFREYRMFKAPAMRIGDVKEGPMKVQGEAHSIPGKETVSPITGTRCVRYYACIYEERSEDGSTYEKVEWSANEGNTFIISDDTGSIMMGLKGRKEGLTIGHFEPLFVKGTSGKALRMANELGIRLKGPLGILDRNLYLREMVMEQGTKFFIVGRAEKNEKEMSDVIPYRVGSRGLMISTEGWEGPIKRKRNWAIGLGITAGVVMVLNIAWSMALLYSLIDQM